MTDWKPVTELVEAFDHCGHPLEIYRLEREGTLARPGIFKVVRWSLVIGGGISKGGEEYGHLMEYATPESAMLMTTEDAIAKIRAHAVSTVDRLIQQGAIADLAVN